MTTFQVIVGGFFVLLIAVELLLFAKLSTRRFVSLRRSLVWILAVICILRPDFLQKSAAFFEIGRGADLLLYGLAISFLLVTFWFIGRLEQQRRQITLLVQELAKKNPVHAPKCCPDRQKASMEEIRSQQDASNLQEFE